MHVSNLSRSDSCIRYNAFSQINQVTATYETLSFPPTSF